jgi:hydroxymethylpyrimidine pyrophosphatase-like HAD family hydrolase
MDINNPGAWLVALDIDGTTLRPDIDLLAWASEGGRGVAMGHAPDDVIAAGNEVTASVDDDGLARVLATLR